MKPWEPSTRAIHVKHIRKRFIRAYGGTTGVLSQSAAFRLRGVLVSDSHKKIASKAHKASCFCRFREKASIVPKTGNLVDMGAVNWRKGRVRILRSLSALFLSPGNPA